MRHLRWLTLSDTSLYTSHSVSPGNYTFHACIHSISLENTLLFLILCRVFFEQVDAVQGYIKEAGVAWFRMWDLIVPFVINYKFVFFYFFSTCLFKDEYKVLVEKLQDRKSYYYASQITALSCWEF